MTILQMVIIQKRAIKEKSLFIFKSFQILNEIFIRLSSNLISLQKSKIKNGTAKIIQKSIQPTRKNNLIFTIKLIRINHKIDRHESHYPFLKKFSADRFHHFFTIQIFYCLLGVTGCEFQKGFSRNVVVRSEENWLTGRFD